MKRGSTFATLDLFEAQYVLLALDTQIKLLELNLARAPKAERYELRVSVARYQQLRDRLAKRVVPAFAKICAEVAE